MCQYKKSILLRKFFISLGILIFIRVGTFLPLPEIDHQQLIYFCKKNSKLKDFIQLSPSDNISILGLFTLNIFPYINASILSQILINYFPKIFNIQKDNTPEFEELVHKLTRTITLFISIFKSINVISYLKYFLPNINIYLKSEIILVLTTGAMIVLWLSELITEYGLGNGTSLVIFTNIVSSLPKFFITIQKQKVSFIYWLGISFLLILIICGIILLQEGNRLVPLVSAKQLNQTLKYSTKLPENYIPLRFNQAGIMPVILTTTILGVFTHINILKLVPTLKNISSALTLNLLYWSSYFILILIFSFFYSIFCTNPSEISNKLQNMSISIPGIRPGKETSFYLRQVIRRITFLGSLSLACLAIIPNLIKLFIPKFDLNETSTPSLLILIGTVSDLFREIRSINLSNIYNMTILN